MSLVSFRSKRGPTLGVIDGEFVVDLGIAEPRLPCDLAGILRSGDDAMASALGAGQSAPAEARLPLESVELLPPAGQHGKIICLGRNFSEHAAEGGNAPPEYPMVFLRTSTSLVGHEGRILRPSVSMDLDYEGELVAFIGKPGRNVPREHALDLVAGYSVFNDGSVRDFQRLNLTVGKNFESTGGFGPAFVPATTLPPGGAGLRIRTRLNGQVMQDGNTSDMIFDVAETIAILSKAMPLEPGDLLVMGTPSGVGAARKPPVFMQPGDVCEVEIDGIGLLRNTIAQAAT